ncbi:hypothetical protein [Leucobacter sp. GX24907]
MAAQHARDDREERPSGKSEQPGEGEGTASTEGSRGKKAEDDVTSDPALDDRVGSDWADEGGATPAGPATSTPGGPDTEESKRQVRIDREREEADGGGSDEHHGDRRDDETGSSEVSPDSPAD